jgi:HD-like signal output (HDOD) protein
VTISDVLNLHHRVAEAAAAMRPLPTSVTRLAAVVGDDDPSIAAVAEVLRQDPALVAAVLREANSAASAARDEIATIEAATTTRR